jgi:HD-GYP domain-containing protein (c-di-GMP phosphodiesterase class II)
LNVGHETGKILCNQQKITMRLENLALVADSSSDIFAQLQPILTSLGLEPVCANDGPQALQVIEESSPLLVLAETELDGLGGFALCARLRQNEATRSIPIILLGTGDDRERRLAALGAGADDFIAKPLDAEDARLRLAALLRRARLKSSTNGNKRARPAPTSPLPGAEFTPSNYSQLVRWVNDVLDQARADKTITLTEIRDASRSLVRDIHQAPAAIGLALQSTEIEDLAAHHVNVAIIGLTLGRELGLTPDLLEQFSLLALVHDLGMTKVPSSILYAPRRLTREEFHQVTEHPGHTREMLKSAGHEALADMAYQEHERESGQGYPRGLKGDHIHELAKILAVADVFEALTHPRSYRKALIPYDALQELIELRGDYFHPLYIKTLMNAVTVFPLGSWVQLNTGETGVVRSTNSKNLMRPVVEIIWNIHGERLEQEKKVDLAESPYLFINKPLYEDQLPTA